MNFQDNEDPINLSNINLIEMMMESENTTDDSKQAMSAVKGTMAGVDMSLEGLGAIAAFVDQSVKLAFAEVIEMARMLGQDAVPVAVLQALMGQQSIAVKMLWDAADFVGVNLVTETPDDLSELDGIGGVQ
jgi:hypothetical protein